MRQCGRQAIGERTSDALQCLKAQGKRYGYTDEDNLQGIVRMHQLWTAGFSYEATAQQLNDAGIPTTLEKPWHAMNVHQAEDWLWSRRLSVYSNMKSLW